MSGMTRVVQEVFCGIYCHLATRMYLRLFYFCITVLAWSNRGHMCYNMHEKSSHKYFAHLEVIEVSSGFRV